MARIMTTAPQAPHHPPAKPAAHPSRPLAAKPSAAAGAHPSHSPHPPERRHPAHRRGRGGLVTALLIAAAVAGACLWFWLGSGPRKLEPGEQLLAQMAAAARGEVAPTHAFGGALTVTRDNGRVNVTAEGLPSRACVQVGWRLAKEGTIIVNGVLPPRLSAARLSELCSGDNATLLWVPEE